MIDKINDKYNKKITKTSKNDKVKNKNNYNVKTNKSVLVNGIKLILKDIIYGTIDKNNLLKVSKSFLIKINTIKDVFNERISKTPHSKWYVQYYASHYMFITLIEALKNKNLKLLYHCLEIINK